MSNLDAINKRYNDDYDPSKGFHRILYRPRYAVQARELIQQQTILQEQIKRFGDHIFQEGTVANGGSFDVQTSVDYVRIELNDNVDSLTNKTLTGQTTDLNAVVVHAELDEESGETIAFVRYTDSSDAFSTFQSDEQLRIGITGIGKIADRTDAVSKGAIFSITEGILYFKSFFIAFDRQSVILSLSENPSVKVSFSAEFTVVNANDDESLLDNAQGSPNFTAPGADRLAAELKLNVFGPDEDIPEDHSKLLELVGGQTKTTGERTEYARVGSELAKRTYDESGDYVVRGMTVYSREHLDTGDNGGRFELDDGGDPDLISIGVEPGLAYVKGFELETRITNYVDVKKSKDYGDVNNQVNSVRASNFFLTNQITGILNVNGFQSVDLYDAAENRLDNGDTFTKQPDGTKIGSAVVRTVTTELEGDVQWNRVYVMNVEVDPGKDLDDVRSIWSGTYFADVIPSQDGTVLRGQSSQSLLIGTSAKATRSIRSENGSPDTSFSFSRTNTFTSNSSGVFSISTPRSSESLPYGEGELFAINKGRIIVSVNEDCSSSVSGTISINGTTVTGSGTSFTTQFTVGERVRAISSGVVGTIKQIVSDTQLELVFSPGTTVTNEAFEKYFIVGDVISLNGYGSNGRRTVVATVNEMTIDLKESFGDSVQVSSTYNVTVNEALEKTKTILTNRLVKINLDTIDSIFNINLGVPDVLKIKSVRYSSSEFEDVSDGIDVTSNYILNNGQTDLYYDHSSLIAKSNQYTSGNLLVTFDYFDHSGSSGVGYFSVDSYPIDDEVVSDTTIRTINLPTFSSTVDGEQYELRNYLDFRPRVVATAIDTTDLVNATENPNNDMNFATGTNTVIPTPGTQVTYDFSYYMARKDVVVVDPEGNFSTISGTPSKNPVFPYIDDGVMAISQIYVPPYPSIGSTFARILGKESRGVQSTRVANKRYSMRDIGRLDNRIKTLEYYNALTLLEKSASDLTIPDENGLDRFKNGFFVDGFLDHSLGQQQNPDYKIAVDRGGQNIRPVFETNSFKLKQGSISGNAYRNKDFVSLKWTEVPLLEQDRVTTFRNIEQSVFRFIGNITLDPPIDTFTDETTIDKTIERGDLEDDFGITKPEGQSVEWKSWESTSKGTNGSLYSAYDRAYGDRVNNITPSDKLIGSFSSYAEAKNAAENADNRTKIAVDVSETVTKKKNKQAIYTNVNVDRETEELGTFVTDVSVTPYIRPQKIEVYAQGMKARTKYFVFFEGEKMNKHFTPYQLNEDGEFDTSNEGNAGDEIRSNEFGEVYGYLTLPENGKQFRIGTKTLRLTDSPTNAEDASSYAEENFVANGLSVKKQNTIYSTIVDATVETTEGEVQSEIISQKSKKEQRVDILGPSCMAYSFLIDVDEEQPGVFLSSIDVFIQSLHPTLGVWFEIREMNNAGGITRKQVPYSEVWMKRNDPRLRTSDDGSVPTNINFDNPVFLLNNTQYAFVIHTEGLNPDTYFFVSRLGETDLRTGEQVTGRQLTGTTYTTNNNLNWDIVPDVDLTVRFNRAEFDNSSAGMVDFDIGDYEFIYSEDLTDSSIRPGDTVVGSGSFTVSRKEGSGVVQVGDQIESTTNESTSSIVAIDGSVIFTDGFDQFNGDKVNLLDSDGNTKNTTFLINSKQSGKAEVFKINRITKKIILHKSNGEFFKSGLFRNNSQSSATLTNFYEFPYHLINFNGGTLPFRDADYSFRIQSVDAFNGTSKISPLDVGESINHEFDTLNVLKSKSDEDTKSMALKTTFSSNSSYVSPVFDTQVMSTTFVQNIINDNIENEDLPSGGSLINKYISKTIVLDEGQRAQDFKCYLTAYHPPESDIYVWVRVKNNNDQESISKKEWVLLDKNNDNVSARSNPEDYIELEYTIPSEYMTGEFGEFQYTGNTGRVFTGYDVFEVKVGLSGTDKVVVPKAADLRAIALQV